MSDTVQKIPASVVRRLPRYYACVQEMLGAGASWVSSKELADRLDLTGSTVRQDLSYVDIVGIQKKGYAAEALERSLARMLGADQEVPTVIVGAGNLGRAMALHGEFRGKGFRICAILDADPAIVGDRVGDLTIRPMSELVPVVRSSQVSLGIIAVPSSAAQRVADHLVMAGVQGLLNFAHVHLIVPRWVSVVDTRITAALQELRYTVRTNPYVRPIPAV